MRAVFVNYCHPDTPHVCGVRVPSFAKAMARRGHQIVLVTKTLCDDEKPIECSSVEAALVRHDWCEPFHLACSPVRDRWLARARAGAAPALVRKAIFGLYYLRDRGVFSDWVQGTQPYWSVLARTFRPHVTWGTFGNSDTWRVAQGVAQLAGCAWVGDMKDGWDQFIPLPLRKWLAGAFRDAAAFTANSEYFAAQAHKWFVKEARVVYSGVSACFLDPGPEPTRPKGPLRITLTGGLYDDDLLQRLVESVADWTGARRESEPTKEVQFIYAGTDSNRFRRHAVRLDGLCRTTVHDYLSLREFAALCRGADLNAYIRNHHTFHHKLLELLACGKPLLAFPGESEESISLATVCGGTLLVASTGNEVKLALDRVSQPRTFAECHLAPSVRQFSWDARALILEQVLATAQTQLSG